MNKSSVFLGIDIGSVSLNIAVVDVAGEIVEHLYARTFGKPIECIQKNLPLIATQLPLNTVIAGVGVTGSGRQLVGAVLGADIIKNEITAHAVAALQLEPAAQTVIEIGGQDSKIIIIREGVVVDFAMNSVCAAGTGSFLDQQAARLGVPIEQFSELALLAQRPARIAGRCTVFAESDMIHKQQIGYSLPDIIAGLCEALVRNYLNNVGRGKRIFPEIIFQGGVAANLGIHRALETALQQKVRIPRFFDVMGAIGAALLVRENPPVKSRFRGFEIAHMSYSSSNFECKMCGNHCEIVSIRLGDQSVALWGDRCGRYSGIAAGSEAGSQCLESVCGNYSSF